MAKLVSARLRRSVERRADFLCEYCLIAAGDTYVNCQVDHVVSEKRRIDHVGQLGDGLRALQPAKGK